MKTGTLVILGLIGAGTAYVILRETFTGTTPAGIGQAIGGAAVDAAAGAVVGIGQAVGIPATNQTECQRAIAEGRTWDASFACPAGTFIKHVFS